MKKKLRPIMIVGTGSDVGKSVINAAFCRIFIQDGYSPAPYKAQNMSLNSYATPDDLEIGRAQAMQAEACKIDCRIEMNPVLLKPTNYKSSQVVLNGKPVGNKSASDYFLRTDRDYLFQEAYRAFQSLEKDYNPIVLEGAGSISEINLWDKDITNMRIAQACNAATYLIADIDRGGVFASVYGTIKLLPKEQVDLIEGVIINKFRGDIKMFEDGKKILEDLIQKPVVGIIPYFNDIYLEQEDSVVIDYKARTLQDGKINVAVVLLPHMSNFTDFDNLERTSEVHLFYTNELYEIEQADIVIIPGSKNTIADLIYLKDRGIDKALKNREQQGKTVYGICGGYQLMGEKIYDPDHVEGEIDEVEGLGLLPIKTVLTSEKITRQVNFTYLNFSDQCDGYEIHMGETKSTDSSPLCQLEHTTDGYFKNSNIWGTYIHGIFDNPIVVEYILKQVKEDIIVDFHFKDFKDNEYDRLAELVRRAVDMEYIYKTMEL